MSSIHGDGLSVGKAAHVVPNDFIVTKAWPAVSSRLLLELVEGTTDGGLEKWLAAYAIVKGSHFRSINLLEESSLHSPVSRVLGVMPIVAANIISSLEITAVSQIRLYGILTGSVSLLRHQALSAHDRVSLSIRGHPSHGSISHAQNDQDIPRR